MRSSPRHGGFTVLLTSTLFSGVSNAMAAVGLPWLVLEHTGEASSAGLVAAAGSLPLLAGIVFGGVVVDKMGRVLTSVVSDVLSAVSVLLVAVFYLQDWLPLPLLVALVVLGAVFDQSGVIAEVALVADYANSGGLSPQRANALHAAATGLAATCGPGLAGLLIGVTGVGWMLCATTVLPALAAALTFAVRRSVPSGRGTAQKTLTIESGEAAPRAVRRHLAYAVEGFSVVRANRLLRVLAILSFGFSIGSLPVQNIALPQHFQARGSPEVLGLFLLCTCAGGIVGALAFGALTRRISKRTLFIAAIAGSNVLLFALATLPDTLPLLVLATALGLVAGPITPIFNIALQARVPTEALGRAISVFTVAACIAAPVGYVVCGPLIDAFGAGAALLLLAVAMVPISLVALLSPALRALDSPVLPVGPANPRPVAERTE
ncbi:MFS transporter [Streptomyces sp. A5-4]|uniref:MFS transporter n=1 Tax=Streptomyces sp. A5-4 TaxID=3384771 RepID=UPI003DA7B8A9